MRFETPSATSSGRSTESCGECSGWPDDPVVDSGGLFVGRRYIVPIGKVALNRSARTFTIEFTKEALRRYPEFHRHSFLAMTDAEARLYEERVLEAVDPESAREVPPGLAPRQSSAIPRTPIAGRLKNASDMADG